MTAITRRFVLEGIYDGVAELLELGDDYGTRTISLPLSWLPAGVSEGAYLHAVLVEPHLVRFHEVSIEQAEPQAGRREPPAA